MDLDKTRLASNRIRIGSRITSIPKISYRSQDPNFKGSRLDQIFAPSKLSKEQNFQHFRGLHIGQGTQTLLFSLCVQRQGAKILIHNSFMNCLRCFFDLQVV